MSSLKRWRQVGQGQFQKWETPGQELEGTWQGMHEGRFGALGTLETTDGRLTFPLPPACPRFRASSFGFRSSSMTQPGR
jgi:hypothetical protein